MITKAATVVPFKVIIIMAVQSFRELRAGLARSGRDWGGADRT